MPAPFCEKATSNYDTDGTVTLPSPSPVPDGRVLLFSVGSDFPASGNTSYTPPSGVTDCGAGYVRTNDTAAGTSGQVFYKQASSESGDYDFSESAAIRTGGIALRISGADPDSPIHKVASAFGDGGSLPSIPQVTTEIDNCLVVSFVWWDESKTLENVPTDWTQIEHLDISALDGWAGSIVQTEAGLLPAATLELSNATRWVAFTVAIAPNSGKRVIASALEAAIQSNELLPIYFCEFSFDSGTVRLWTGGVGNIIWNGETWTGGGALLKIEPAAETVEMMANSASFILSGMDQTIAALALAEDPRGRSCKVWFDALDSQTGQLIADAFQLPSGMMDVFTIDDDPSGATIGLSVESSFLRSNHAKVRRFTPEDQALDYPDDTGLRHVARLQDAKVEWG